MSEIDKFLDHPISFILGAVTTFVGVMGAVVANPSAGIGGVIDVLVVNATNLFTGLSITAFTLAPEVSWLPSGPLKVLALGAGAVVVAKIADSLWDSIKRRLT